MKEKKKIKQFRDFNLLLKKKYIKATTQKWVVAKEKEIMQSQFFWYAKKRKVSAKDMYMSVSYLYSKGAQVVSVESYPFRKL